MKSNLTNKLLLGMAVMLTTTAFAAEKGSMKLIQPTVVGGVQLTPGDYNLSWDGSGPNLEVKVMKDGKSVATVPARAIELKETPAANGTNTKLNAEGRPAVSQVFFRGKTKALEIAPDVQGQSIAATK